MQLVKAPIHISFEEVNEENQKIFEREFESLSQADDDPISQWLRLAKAKGDTQDSDPVLLQLVVDLHRKIDSLEKVIKNEESRFLTLENSIMIDSIYFDNFKLDENILENKKLYYGRIEMPNYPKHDIPVYFKIDEMENDKTVAKIEQMHEQDLKDWASYVRSRERIMIRQLKAQ